MESNKSLMQQIADLLASGELGFHPYSWAFGVVDVSIVPRLFPERIVRISVPGDDWNDSPLGSTAKRWPSWSKTAIWTSPLGTKRLKKRRNLS